MKYSVLRTNIYRVLRVTILFALMIFMTGCSKENTTIVSADTVMSAEDGNALFILEREVQDFECPVRDGAPYIPLSLAQDIFNSGFYWDEAEQVMSYVIPGTIMRVYPDLPYYYSNDGVKGTDVPALIIEKGTCYVSTEFVSMYSGVRFAFFEEPARIVTNYKQNEFLEYSVIGSEGYLHTEPNVESQALRLLAENDKLFYISGTGKGGKEFVKVMTEDGIFGYVQLKHLGESYYNSLSPTKVEYPEDNSCMYDGKIKLGWHQISSAAGNDTYATAVAKADGMNVISPTWYRLAAEDGTIDSIGDPEYVNKAHGDGLQVWPLVDNFADGVSSLKPLSSTKTREVIIKNLIDETLRLGADGINIDFEALSKETGVHFVEFLKELSVKCHEKGLTLSVDDYVPSAYRAYYDLETQGKFVDYVILMAYDEHYAGSQEAGSVSSISYVTNAISDCLKMVKKEHIIVALPFYTRIWMEDSKGVTSEARSMNGAASFIEENNLKTKWDNETAQNYAECIISGTTYKVWLEDNQSLSHKLQAILNNDLGGAAFWRLGQEADGIWELINTYIQ